MSQTDEIEKLLNKVRIKEELEPLSSHAVLGDCWRDARKDLPTQWGSYLCVDRDEWIMILEYEPNNPAGERWLDENHLRMNPTHWMPLPDPPNIK